MYTYGSAWCGFEEHVKGSIAPGKYADLVVLSADPRAVEPDAIKEIQALLTLVDGRDRLRARGRSAPRRARWCGPPRARTTPAAPRRTITTSPSALARRASKSSDA